MTNAQAFSAESVGGWKNCYTQLQRWHGRAIEALTSEDDNDRADQLDCSLAFMVWNLALRDWVEHDLPRLQVSNLLTSEENWSYCRDIGNRAKHFSLKRPSIDDDFGISWSYDPFNKHIFERQYVELVVWIDAKKLPMKGIVTGMMQFWRLHLDQLYHKK